MRGVGQNWRRILGVFAAVMLWAVAPLTAQDVQRQVDRDVWIPLMRASNVFDAEGFLAVQSPDLVRVAADENEVYGLARYASEIRAGFERARARGLRRASDVRFLTRTASAELAYETGYFRSRVTLPDGEVRTRYSRFEFVLRIERGVWRILVDKDSADGGRITAEEFESATPIDLAPNGVTSLADTSGGTTSAMSRRHR